MPVLVTDVVVLRLCVADGVLLGELVYVEENEEEVVKVGDDDAEGVAV